MNRVALNIDEVFFAALEIGDRNARSVYLDEICGDDADLRHRIEGLLAVNPLISNFLESPAIAPVVTIDHPCAEVASTLIGPYKLLELIAEGGMGAVYVAEQSRPVRRRVALKVIKPGMDTKQVLARFESERQTLALMDHPNIAKVHDAGATPEGRPYFVMELVKGLPITDYCDKARLSVPERLDLFVLVCRAVQHAHQKGIIHRDLKPSNILVTVIDGAAVPKVIDFGIAKSTGAQLTDRTVYTGFAQLIGTPLYMSPEQAELSGVDVDTRSDVYALGVLLYELLTGTTPIDRDTLCKAAYDEIRRVVREQEPPTPSTRLGSLGETLSAVSANRHSDARKLGQSVRGELDWIVMKALEKDRTRRYESASDFAADVMRHLTDQPVEACPPSARYRLGKFARRNRAALTTAGLVGLALVVGLGMSTWQAVRARAAEGLAVAAWGQAEAHLGLARQAIDEMYDQVADRWLNDVRWGPLPRAFLEKVLPFYQRFAADRRVDSGVGRAHMRVGEVLGQLGRWEEADQSLRRAEAIFRALRVTEPEDAEHVHQLAQCYFTLAIMGGDSPPHREAIALYEELVARFPGDTRYRREWARSLISLGVRLLWTKQPGAEGYLDRTRLIMERLASAHPEIPEIRAELGGALNMLGNYYRHNSRFEEAESTQRRALNILDDLATRYPTRPKFLQLLAYTRFELSNTLVDRQKYGEVPLIAGQGATLYQGLENEYPNSAWFRRFVAQCLCNVARAQFQLGRREEAEQAIRRIEMLGDDALAAEQIRWIAGDLCYSNDPRFCRPAEALALVERSLALGSENGGFIPHVIGVCRYRLGDIDAALLELERAQAILKDDLHLGAGFFLAMAYHRKGDLKRSRDWYHRSVKWLEEREPTDRYLIQYRAEADALLGVKDGPRADHAKPDPGPEKPPG